MLSSAASNRTPPSEVQGLPDGRAAFLGAFARGLRPPPRISVSEWAERERRVPAESGSSHPGRWRNALAPYLVEFMDCLDFAHPAREVSVVKSAQSGFTEAALNLVGWCIDTNPAPILYVLPSLDEANKFNKIKLQPAIDETPALRAKVAETKSRDEDGSTGAFKRFRGGFMVLTGANSSKGLQMISVRVVIFDEVSEYPPDAGGRGDPVKQAEARNTVYDRIGYKRVYISVPAVDDGQPGSCRITEKVATGDQRRYYLPCPHCGIFQPLRWKHMKWKSDTAPHGAWYACQANGCAIEYHHLAAMLPLGVWIKTFLEPGQPLAEDATEEERAAERVRLGIINAGFKELMSPEEIERLAPVNPAKGRREHLRSSNGRHPSFYFWQGPSPFMLWDTVVGDFIAARGDQLKLKTFVQQRLGEAWEVRGEAPDWERLFARREDYRPRVLPAGVLVITVACDVQQNGIYFEVRGRAAGNRSWVIDAGFLPGEPADENDRVWEALAELYDRRYPDAFGHDWQADAFAIDSGYATHQVYFWVRDRPRAFAVDGRGGWGHPAMGMPSKVDITLKGRKVRRGTLIWPVGTWSLKGALYANLRKEREPGSELGPPGLMHFGTFLDRSYFQQLTAEYLDTQVVKATGRQVKVWKTRGANHFHDCAVYNDALAEHLRLSSMDDAAWARLAEKRGQSAPQSRDLVGLMQRPAPPPITVAPPAPANAVRHDTDQDRAVPPSGGSASSGPQAPDEVGGETARQEPPAPVSQPARAAPPPPPPPPAPPPIRGTHKRSRWG